MQNFHSLYPSVRYDPDMIATPVRWLVEDFWQIGKINGMAGFEKSGKSRLMNWLLVGMHTGNVLGLQAMPQRVLYLCGEEPRDLVNSRVRRYAGLQGIGDAKLDIDFVEASAMRLDHANQRRALLERLLGDNREMLVIDPWRRVHGADENDSQAMGLMYNDMRHWSNKYNITVLILHHTPKLGEDSDLTRMATWFRGSTDLPAILDTAQYVDRLNKRRILVHRQGRFPPLGELDVTDLGGIKLNDDKGFQRA